jgi:pyrimidine operon attenuation protein/uracil phosphoribosyltransferase
MFQKRSACFSRGGRLYFQPTDFSANVLVIVSKKENVISDPDSMKTLLNAEQIKTTTDKLFNEIISDINPELDLAIIGLRSRGEILAQRLTRKFEKQLGRKIPCGTLDITLYRDDLHSPRGGAQPTVRATEIEFDVNDKFILLVDDVLHTGRSVRAAMDALTDLGRPRTVRLAVLVDRGDRELPIRADYVGIRAEVGPSESVSVHLVEEDQVDEVIVE